MSTAYKIKIEREIPEQDLLDVLTTAYEQGISYWVTKASGTKRAEDLSVVITCLHFEDQGDGVTFATVDTHTVLRGVERILSREVEIRSDLHAQVASLLSGDPDVDADAADCIVQAGIFGEVVYG